MMTRYSEEFREGAVRLVLESRSSISQVARDLGVSVWTLRGWVKKYREKSRLGEPRRAETIEEENTRLKRELAVLRQERDILKKAAAYFAKEQL
jgi:transposase